MTVTNRDELAAKLKGLDASSPLYATQFIELLLEAGRQAGASDLHLNPTERGLLAQWRIDGVLAPVGEFSRGQAADVVTRLKVLAGLLTYRTDMPQEGRLRPEPAGGSFSEGLGPAGSVEVRVSTFPTLHGERAAVRLFAPESQYSFLADLQLPGEIEAALGKLLHETSGAILLTGPAGSGKTTTAYACLREIVRASGGRRNVVTLEDPIEVALPGVSQSQVNPAAGFSLAMGLRSLMRQDPEVILVGEIRDLETAQTVIQAALTGSLVISTFHAGSAAAAVSRLLDMQIEPYLLTSSLIAVLHQRLLRRLCTCAVAAEGKSKKRGGGCELCRSTGYRGRLAAAELLPPLRGALAQAVLQRQDRAELHRIAREMGMTTIGERAQVAIHSGQTDLEEVRRVLGLVAE